MDIYGYQLLQLCWNSCRKRLKTIEPGNGRCRANQTELDMLDNVYPRNDLTAMEKLVMVSRWRRLLQIFMASKTHVILTEISITVNSLRTLRGKLNWVTSILLQLNGMTLPTPTIVRAGLSDN
jgi:hypothetical protein